MYNSLLVRRWQFPGKLFTLVSFDKSGGAQPTPPSGKKVMDMLMTREPGGACAVWESRSGSAVRGAGQQCVCVFVCACSQRSCRGRTTYVTEPLLLWAHRWHQSVTWGRCWPAEGMNERMKDWLPAPGCWNFNQGFLDTLCCSGRGPVLGRSLLCSEPGVCRQMEVTVLDPDPQAEGSEGEGPCIPSSPGTEPVVLEYPVEYDPYG